MSVVKSFCSAGTAQLDEAQLLAYPGVWVGRVAQKESIEARAMAGIGYRLINGAEARHQVMRVLIIGRQQHGSPRRDVGDRAVAVDGQPARTPCQQDVKS